MKVKQSPDDFRVEELTDVEPGESGDHALYRLTKTGWTTVDALQIVRRRWKIDHHRESHGGLKDRHAHTVQHFSIAHGPKRNLSHSRLAVEYLGQVPHPFNSRDIRANRFTIVIRDLSEDEAARAEEIASSLGTVGVPNYFDDQRFGSVGYDNRFIAREMIFQRYEEALKLALAAPNKHDRAATKREKEILNRHWGDWSLCKDRLPRGHARSLVDYLRVHPGDFKGACARLRPELRGLYLSAYQSHLWNRMLATWIRKHTTSDQLGEIELRLGRYPVPHTFSEEERARWLELTLPLPSARLRFDPDAPWADVVTEVMAEEGLELNEMKIRGFQRPYFSKGDRAGAIRPASLVFEGGTDERNPGRRMVRLEFELPRGSYATMIIKRLTG